MLQAVAVIKKFSLVGLLKRDARTGDVSTCTDAEANAALFSLIQAKVDEGRNAVQPDKFPLSFKRHSPVYGSVKPDPSAKIVKDPSPHRPRNKDFKRRSAAGEIVLSDYKSWGAVLSYKNGQIVDRKVKYESTFYGLSNYYPHIGEARDGSYIKVGNYWYNVRIDIEWDYVYYKDEQTPYQFGWSDPSSSDLEALISQVVNAGMVTETLADHNDRVIDLLTTMAEMPETIEMIYNAIKECLRLYVACRKKEFRLQNKVAEWKNAITSDRARRQAYRNITELNAAIADVWLTYRYGIMPNVYLIEDALKVLNAPKTMFLRDRSRKVLPIQLPSREGWTQKEVNITHRCMIKSRLLNDAKVDAYMSANVFKTAWELIPLSFVIDWFINVGDMLSATTSGAYAQQGATYSWKIDDTFTFVHNESNAMVEIKFSGYKRIVIDPLQFCKFQWNPSMNTSRYADSLALAWKIFMEGHFRKLS